MGTGSRDKSAMQRPAGGGGPVTPPPERPLCKCHGEPMVSPSGWHCAVKVREAARRHREANPEKAREYRRRRYEADGEKEREYRRRRYEANREKEREYMRRWRENHFVLRIGDLYMGSYSITPAQREKLQTFREEQRASYRTEAEDGWID